MEAGGAATVLICESNQVCEVLVYYLLNPEHSMVGSSFLFTSPPFLSLCPTKKYAPSGFNIVDLAALRMHSRAHHM